jgi:hypothetical protein
MNDCDDGATINGWMNEWSYFGADSTSSMRSRTVPPSNECSSGMTPIPDDVDDDVLPRRALLKYSIVGINHNVLIR